MSDPSELRRQADMYEKKANIQDAISQAEQLEMLARQQDVCNVKTEVGKTVAKVVVTTLIAATTGISM